MKMPYRMCSMVAVVAFVSLADCMAQTNTVPAAKPKKPAEPDPIGEQIASKNPEQVQRAVEAIWEQLHATTTHEVNVAVLGLIRKHWLDGLMAQKRYEDVTRLTQGATLAVAWNTQSVEALQSIRTRALLRMGKTDEALGAAKGVFNICRMQNTANALQLVVECLRAAHPGDEAVIDKLREEQKAGSEANTGARSAVLDSIKVDGSIYRSAILERTGEDYGNATALGNLLLLADRAKEARPAFNRAYAVAKTNDLAAATESIARCMKAEDGTIGRANAWVLSVRP
jgi:tetratricopeptide (TPR) repeat protein